MKPILILILFVLSLISPATVYVQDPQPVPSGGMVLGKDSQNIPVNIFEHIIYLPVKVNGEPLVFILDTGAGGMSAIDVKAAKKLNLPLMNKQPINVGAGEDFIHIYSVDGISVSLPGMEFLDQKFYILPMSNRMDAFWGKRIDGLAGANFLSRVVTVIDYVMSRVHFYEPNSFSYFGKGEKIPFKLKGKIPLIEVKLKIKPEDAFIDGKFLVDTGARTTILTSPFARKLQLTRVLPVTIKTTVGFGIGGETRGHVGRIASLKAGNIEFKQPVIAFSKDRRGALASDSFDGIIGADFLHRFTVVFDYSRKKMILQQNKFFDRPFEYDMSGIFFKAEGKRYNVFKVFKLVKPSPAASAGIKQGDVIAFIDGKDTKTMTLQDIRKQMRGHGKTLKLKIKRKGKMIELVLDLKRQV
jgi:predicted aspartyl protease